MSGRGAASVAGGPHRAPSPTDEHPDPRSPVSRGRPRDPHATTRVITATQHLLATRGASISVEAIAAQAVVGKATIYRRWSTVADLLADAVLATDPLPPVPCSTGSTRSQLAALLQRLTDPLSADELTVAAALSTSVWQPRLHEAVERVLLAPLQERVRAACRTAGPAHECAVATVVTVVEGLWIRRLLLTSPPLGAAEVERVVDDAVRGLGPVPATR